MRVSPKCWRHIWKKGMHMRIINLIRCGKRKNDNLRIRLPRVCGPEVANGGLTSDARSVKSEVNQKSSKSSKGR